MTPTKSHTTNATLWLAIVSGLAIAQHVAAQDRVDLGSNGDQSVPERVSQGLLALYDFATPTGSIVRDSSGVGEPANLKIANKDAVQRDAGSLKVVSNVLIQSDGPPQRILTAMKRTGELTIEAWLRPTRKDQKGPARIVTLSKNGTNRNFTLGQDGDKFDFRLRTTTTSNNGLPSLSSKAKSLTNKLTHVVYTRDRSGTARIYLNGKLNQERQISGSLSNWDSYRLGLANEHDRSRQWRGTYYLVAIYDRNLAASEVTRNYQAGVDGRTPIVVARKKIDPRMQHFETQVAAVFANQCLECHDSVSKEGGLDLSKKTAALAGGESGEVIVPGKSLESLLWESLDSDEMPKDRQPLSDQEKLLVKKWIDDGAVWSLDTIDPAVYAHNSRASQDWLRRLTIAEYIETVRHGVGVDISKEARELLPPDLRADGFSNTAYNLSVDLKHVDAYGRLAEIIVQRMDVLEFSSRFSQRRKFTDNDMGKLLANMGKWLLRGPLDEHEIIAFRGISTTAIANGADFEEAVGLMIEAMLQSPRFLYRIEDQRGDGNPSPLSEYEVAARLSYIIWGGPPDEELMRAADDGELFDVEAIRLQAQRMLQHPRAVAHSARFLSEWLNLGRLQNMQPNVEKFPNWNQQLANAMREETLAFFHEVVWKQHRPLSDLMNAQVTFVTPQLAAHYGLPEQDQSPDRNGLVRYDLASVPGRGGLLTQGSTLTVGGDEASMVTRGLFVMHELLRGVVKAPPPCVDTTPVPTKAGLTQRGVALERIANANCGGCHVRFEPLAFGLEKFDGLGGYHDRDEHGNELRDDGEILFPGDEQPITFNSAATLMNLLAESDRVAETITWKLTQFALGRPLVAADAAAVGKIHEATRKAGGTYRDLVTAIVTSDLILMKTTEADN